MTKVLFIKSSPLPAEFSRSTQVAQYFLNEYVKAHPDHEIEELDLYHMEMPYIDSDVFNGWNKLANSIPLTETESAKIETINALTEQFMKADKYIFVSPLWNLGIPPMLKAYFDNVSVAGKTFKYTEAGSVGLLENKLAIHFHGRGGIYSDGKRKEYADPYVRGILEFLGVKVLPSIYIEGIDYNPEQAEEIIEKAKDKAKAALSQFELDKVLA